MDNMSEQAKEIVNRLSLVKEEFIRDKEELKLSIRRDVIITQLKDILVNNVDIHSLRNAIEELIQELQIWNYSGEGDNKNDTN